jgi:hypothetical protein
MREIRTSGSEGGGAQAKGLSLPLSRLATGTDVDGRDKPGHDAEGGPISSGHALGSVDIRGIPPGWRM